MRVIKEDREFLNFIKVLRNRSCDYSNKTVREVTRIINDVRKKGDRALLEYTNRFDSHRPESLKLSRQKINSYSRVVDKDFLKATDVSRRRIRYFHERQRESSWTFARNGETLGQIIRPIERVGIYVPGGKASYPSSVLMNVIPAQVAGVREIALCVPAPYGEINSYVMAALSSLGIKEVYTIGGAQAIAAMAFGTETIRKVDKIVGPGNIYVAIAKRLVFGEVDIDMIAGPSEILIVADSKANPYLIAADLLSQAEHDEMASSILITTSKTILNNVKKELNRQLKTTKRKEIAKRSIKNYCALIHTGSLRKAFKYVNTIAPEHLEIMTEDPERKVPLVKNSGAIFLGKWTPEPLGDYSAGPNHTLPTCGTSRFFSPLGVYDFIKRSSLLHFNENAFRKIAPTVKTIAEVEGLECHANTINVRLDLNKSKK